MPHLMENLKSSLFCERVPKSTFDLSHFLNTALGNFDCVSENGWGGACAPKQNGWVAAAAVAHPLFLRPLHQQPIFEKKFEKPDQIEQKTRLNKAGNEEVQKPVHIELLLILEGKC